MQVYWSWVLSVLCLLVNYGEVAKATNSSFNDTLVDYTFTNLTVTEKNNSLAERGSGSVTLFGGFTVQGTWKVNPERSYERPCTLSFPVKNEGRRLGFLTSYACSNENFSAQDANGHLIEVGFLSFPYHFIPSQGLDYRFVLADDNYWSDSTSKRIAFIEHFREDDRIFLEMLSPTRPPFPGIAVCAFGGMNHAMVCGKIVEFGVTIHVPTPGTNGEESVRFADAVKVSMEEDYEVGYLGSPVYIPAPVPYKSMIVASPVGQVIETIDQYKEVSQQPNIWYYVPINRILADGKFTLLEGDFNKQLS